jgi:LacI family transcriptional regulator
MGRSSLLGLIVPDIGNPFFPEITRAFQDAACLAGLETIVINTNYDLQRTRDAIDRLISLRVPGAAFLTSQVDLSVRQSLSEKGICAVYLEHDVAGPHISNIAIDYRHGIESAVQHLLSLGHRRIGYIGGPANGSTALRRKTAFLESVAARGDVETCVVDSDFTVQGGYSSCSKVLGGFSATAVIAADDTMAIGAMHCAYDRKTAVPAELSVIGFNDITFARYTQPALTTVAIPAADVGRLAFQSLWQLVADSTLAGMEYEVKTSLVIRQTTAPPARQ